MDLSVLHSPIWRTRDIPCSMEPASAIHIHRIDDVPVALNARPLGRSIRIRKGISFGYGHSGKFSVSWVELGWVRRVDG